ncbi:HK97 gp10 family phage protein [Lactococcus garvieae]|uniref:Putative phage protein n=1 Tax=Lactococcus garvieae DCC43 TaxID=1231377 RepID=K2PN92_9LACT|nr:HK97 gp10 family phage protein [Lactococcus garvieae]EKF51719.1 putative phage protein [Lactococcus garvieae DCC43]
MPAEMNLIGFDEVIANLERKLSPARVQRVVNKSLRNTADVAVNELKSVQGAGETASGVTHGNVSRATGVPIIKIGNKGKHWRLVHLNEFGYTRNGKTFSGARQGALRRFAQSQEQKFPEIVRKELEELTK